MFDSDITPFAAMLEEVWPLWPHAKPLTSGQATIFFRALAAYPLDRVRGGFDLHVKDPKRGKFAPVPADIIAAIEGLVANDGRPGAEEAWAISVRSMVEADTIVWTDEMAIAWGIASPIMGMGDEVGARMAFREAYVRLVDEARVARRPVSWSASLGHDRDQREIAIAHAANLGRIEAPQATLLPGPTPAEEERARRYARPVTGLGQLLERAPPHIRDRLRRVADELANRVVLPDSDKHVDAGIRRTEELREAHDRKMAEYEELLQAEYRPPDASTLPPRMRKGDSDA